MTLKIGTTPSADNASAAFMARMGDPGKTLLDQMRNRARFHQETEEMARNLKGKQAGQIDEAAKQFEAVFATEMLKPMFEGLKPDKTFGGGHAEEVYQGMMMEQYGKIMADRGGLGIADAVKHELLRIQEQKGQHQIEGPAQ
jgi:Rod binding domain-containing protein